MTERSIEEMTGQEPVTDEPRVENDEMIDSEGQNNEPARKLGFWEGRRARADMEQIRKLEESANQARIALEQADESLRKAPATGGYSGEPVSQWSSHEQSTHIGNKTQAEQNYKDALMTLKQARADFETKYGQEAQ